MSPGEERVSVPYPDRPTSGSDGPHNGRARSDTPPPPRGAVGAWSAPEPLCLRRSASIGPLRASFFSRSSETPPSRPNSAQRGAGAPGAGAAEALYGAVRICGVLTWTTTGPDSSEGARELMPVLSAIDRRYRSEHHRAYAEPLDHGCVGTQRSGT